MESDRITEKYRLRPSIETQSSEGSSSKLSVEADYKGGDTISKQSSHPSTIKKGQEHSPQRETQKDEVYDTKKCAFLEKPVHESYQSQSEESSNSDINLNQPFWQQSVKMNLNANHQDQHQSVVDSRDRPPTTTTNQAKQIANIYDHPDLLPRGFPHNPDAYTRAEDIFATTEQEFQISRPTKTSTQKLHPKFEYSTIFYFVQDPVKTSLANDS